MGCGKIIIACRIFENEVNAIISDIDDMKYHWIDAALHADPVKMKRAIDLTASHQCIEVLTRNRGFDML